MFNMPHRDVQKAAVDYKMEAKDLVNEYLKDAKKANDRYLQEEGESKIIAVTGIVASVDEDMNHQKVVLLRDSGESAGVSCTFMASTNVNAEKLKNGDKVTIKGVIRSGAGYDEDLELYEDVIIEKCDVIQI
jgi:RecG-like helicase